MTRLTPRKGYKSLAGFSGIYNRKTLLLRFDFRNDAKRYTPMAVTELKRKARKNRARANNAVERIKQLTRKPEIRNVDVEAIKASFAEKAQAAA
jgi:hypothetical protein